MPLHFFYHVLSCFLNINTEKQFRLISNKNIKKPCSNHLNKAFFVNCGFKENQKHETYAQIPLDSSHLHTGVYNVCTARPDVYYVPIYAPQHQSSVCRQS